MRRTTYGTVRYYDLYRYNLDIEADTFFGKNFGYDSQARHFHRDRVYKALLLSTRSVNVVCNLTCNSCFKSEIKKCIFRDCDSKSKSASIISSCLLWGNIHLLDDIVERYS